MIEPCGDGSVFVRRLRLRGNLPDPLGARIRAEDLLAREQARPHELQPAAILEVRSLHGRVSEEAFAMGIGYRRSWRWHESLRSALSQLARTAAHPGRENVRTDVPAVIFDDAADMLACLARNWCAGVVAARWWWQHLLGDQDKHVLDAWRNAATSVPAAFGRLADDRLAAAFVRRLGGGNSWLLLVDVLDAFRLHALGASLGRLVRPLEHGLPTFVAPSDDGRALEYRGAKGSTLSGRGPRGYDSNLESDWYGLIPEVFDQALGAVQRCLIAVALTLYRAPHRATVPSFLRNLAFLAEPRACQSDPEAECKDDQRPSSPFVAEAARGSAPGSAISGVKSVTSSLPRGEWRGETTSGCAARDATPVTARVARTRSVETIGPGVTPEERLERGSDDTSAPTSTPPCSSHPSTGVEEEPPIETDLGGFFYLINLGLFLGLYGDFTTPGTPGIGLSLWDFVAVVGRHLIGERRRDPIWDLLARLAGRKRSERPGRGFEPASD